MALNDSSFWTGFRGSEIAQRVKIPAAKVNDLGSLPRIHMIKGESQPLQSVL